MHILLTSFLPQGRRAAEHEVLHAISHHRAPRYKTDGNYHPATDFNSMIHEAVAALPEDRWSDVEFDQFKDPVYADLETVFNRRSLYYLTRPYYSFFELNNFWKWLEKMHERLGVSDDIPFFMNPLVAKFHSYITNEVQLNDLFPPLQYSIDHGYAADLHRSVNR